MIYNFQKIIYDKVIRHGHAIIMMDEIDQVYSKQLHHHPMYFPLLGMPSLCSTLDDFKKWAKVQDFIVFRSSCDEWDRIIVQKKTV